MGFDLRLSPAVDRCSVVVDERDGVRCCLDWVSTRSVQGGVSVVVGVSVWRRFGSICGVGVVSDLSRVGGSVRRSLVAGGRAAGGAGAGPGPWS